MSAFDDLRKLAKRVLGEDGSEHERQLKPIEPRREADMGGTGDAHEINWGDVTDVVHEGVIQAIEGMIHESLRKMEMAETDTAKRPMKEMSEYREMMEAADEFAKRMGEMFQAAHEAGVISKQDTQTH